MTKKNFKDFDWTTALNDRDFRDNIAAVVKRFVLNNAETEDMISPNDDAASFLMDLFAYVPEAQKFIPSTLDSERIESHRTILSLAFEKVMEDIRRNAKKTHTFWSRNSSYEEPVPANAAFCLALMSKGVSSINYSYTSGTDQIDLDSDYPTLSFLPGFEDQDNEEVCKWACEMSECNDSHSIFWALCDESGAGDGTIWRSGYTIDLFDFGVSKDAEEEVICENDDDDDWIEEEDQEESDTEDQEESKTEESEP